MDHDVVSQCEMEFITMNKGTVIILFLSALISSTSYAYTLYSNDKSSLSFSGRIEPRFNISNANKTTMNSSFDDMSRVRFNIDGKTNITKDINVFGYYSGEVFSDMTLDKNRYMYAGIGTAYGAFSYGQQDSSQVILSNITNIMETFGGSAANITNGNNIELENNVVYTAPLSMDLSVALNYVKAEQIGNDSGGGSVIYNSPIDLQLGVGYVSGQQSGADAYQYTISAMYTISDLYFGAIYVKGAVNHVDIHGFELAAAYTLNHFIFRYVYNFRTSDFTSSQQSGEYSVNYNAIEGVYNVTDDVMIYAGYELNHLAGNINANQFQVGAIYSF